MALARRVFRRFLDYETARRVVARLIWGMSRDRAKEVLQLPRSGDPSDAEIDAAYRKLVRDAIRSNPGVAKNQEALKELNIAKDTLRGQFDRKNPGTGPNAPEQGRQQNQYRPPPPPPRPSDKDWRPPPPPDGEPFAAALHGLGNVDLRIMTEGQRTSEPIYEPDWSRENTQGVYWRDTVDYILVGKTATHWVFAKLQQCTHSRRDVRAREIPARWTAMKVTMPVDKDVLKGGPKVIKALREGARRVAKFAVIEGTLTEENIARQVRSSRLSFLDAVIGSDILGSGASAPTNRKIQVELEPVYNRAKRQDAAELRALLPHMNWDHLEYDWFVFINGKKTQLNNGEVNTLARSSLLRLVFGYRYDKGKRNLTRLKKEPRFVLEELARVLDPGPTRDAVLKAAEAFPNR